MQTALSSNDRTFKIGQRVKWNPPQGAYGPKSVQTQIAGQTGIITKIWNESYLLADMGSRRDVLLNLDFVEAAA